MKNSRFLKKAIHVLVLLAVVSLVAASCAGSQRTSGGGHCPGTKDFNL